MQFEKVQLLFISDHATNQKYTYYCIVRTRYSKFYTYKWNVSLYLGDQLFDFDLVACFRFLSCKCGPIKLISTNGRNMPEAMTHFKSLAATTERGEGKISITLSIFLSLTRNSDLIESKNLWVFLISFFSSSNE